MPWCDTCDRLVDDDELTEHEGCPTCGTDLAVPQRHPMSKKFIFMGVVTTAYLTWRAVQGVQWLSHHV